ncbi:4a-hydroxytetrahydrobiopterin dehydratase [Herbaspirillum sp. RV1423]|uniref:4a-hydroxytetrahydrobiopterin dehydratase n=1 Tax=Herbaspirillum sp. RV1423 TaxID=1443993 RepID=UPI0004B571FC|nr:4a-hydroxytetrahydrobiopterin dehydratase [Herbaspirillum sp. RV1423]
MILTTETLLAQKSQHQVAALTDSEIGQYLPLVPGWTLEQAKLVKSFSFQDYHETLAFVNAIAYVIHDEDHHPELVVTYNRCVVKFDTHSVNEGRGGLSVNDFICAAKVDAVFHQTFSRA